MSKPDFEANLKPNDYWQTPWYIIDAVNGLWPNGWMDPCPAAPKLDGLSYSWCQPAYINPPFSNYLAWANRANFQGNEQLFICAHDHSTERFQTLMPRATALCLLHARVQFITPSGDVGKSPAQCHTLIYRPGCNGNEDNTERFKQVFAHLGLCVEVAA